MTKLSRRDFGRVVAAGLPYLDRLRDFIDLIATAIANHEARAELAASEARAAELADEQAALRRVATLVARGVSPDEIFSAVTNEMAQLFALLADGKAVNAKADSAMLDLLAKNADGELMQRQINGLSVPHKTGATDSVRTECALFRLQSRVVACGFTKQNADTRWVVDNEAQVTLGKLGAAIVAAWPKKEK